MTPDELMELHAKKKSEELDLVKELGKSIRVNSNALYQEIVDELRDIEDKVESWNLEELSKYGRLEKINGLIDGKVKEYKGKEWEMLLSFLVLNGNLVKKNTLAFVAETTDLPPVNIKPVFKVDMKEITGNPWSGLSMKLRHAKSAQDLALKTQEIVTLSIIHESPKEAREGLKKTIGSNADRAESLAITEKTHIDDELLKETLDEIGVESGLLYNALLDSRTCQYCASLHGQEYEKHDAPMLPQHTNCRCFYTPFVKEKKK